MSVQNKIAAQTAAQCLPETNHNAPEPLHTPYISQQHTQG
jgi:hypothetical protein